MTDSPSSTTVGISAITPSGDFYDVKVKPLPKASRSLTDFGLACGPSSTRV